MSTKKGLQEQKSSPAGGEATGASDAHKARKLTFAENMILTVKVLVGFGLLGAAIWAIDLLTSAE